jgi:hypothetical protein
MREGMLGDSRFSVGTVASMQWRLNGCGVCKEDTKATLRRDREGEER